jgi:hypothetical protein
MRTYNQIHFSQISEILMQAALGVSAVCGFKYTISDMVYSLNELGGKMHVWSSDIPFYIAIREQGTECGYKEVCVERCKGLGYPLIIAKIENDKVCDYNMTIMLTHGWMDKDNNYMEQEFDSL